MGEPNINLAQASDISDIYKVPINILKDKTRSLLSELLKSEKLFISDTGLLRDWRGLAELCCIPQEHLSNFELDSDPTTKLLDQWYDIDKDNATIDILLKYLQQMDRFDVIDDINSWLGEDLEYHRKYPEGCRPKPINFSGDKHVLTIDDAERVCQGLEPQIYDAFVLFADDDIDFATEVIIKMEKDYGLKFCVKERDLVAGRSEHETIIKLIAERCDKFIAIITPAFLQSSVHSFFYNFAEFVGIQQRAIKIIPIIYKQCEYLPYELHSYYKLDWGRLCNLVNVWDTLNEAIVGPDEDNSRCRKTSQTSRKTPNRSQKSFYEKLRKIIGLRKNSAVKLDDKTAIKDVPDTTNDQCLQNPVVELKEKTKFWNLTKTRKKTVAVVNNKNCIFFFKYNK